MLSHWFVSRTTYMRTGPLNQVLAARATEPISLPLLGVVQSPRLLQGVEHPARLRACGCGLPQPVQRRQYSRREPAVGARHLVGELGYLVVSESVAEPARLVETALVDAEGGER